MDYKKTKAAPSTITRDLIDIERPTGNIYESIVVLAKRSEQIAKEIKIELDSKLQEFASYSDNLEEQFENREQIEISKYYERMPKPTLIAIEELLEGKINFRKPDVEENIQEE